jgi:hypothetical protein
MAAGGMLSSIFNRGSRDPRQEELDDDQRITALAADPFKAAAMTAYGASRDAGRGVGSAVAAGMGKDPRTPGQRNMAAIEAAKAQVAQLGLDPDDPKSVDEFYKQVIIILQKQGLAAEAAAMSQEYRTAKSAAAKEGLEIRKLERLEKKDAADADIANKRLELQRLQAQPEFAKLLELLANTNDPVQATAITKRLEYMSTRNGKGYKYVPAGDRVEVRDPETNELIDTIKVGTAPQSAAANAKGDAANEQMQSAYNRAKLSAQSDYDAVVELYGHPGLPEVVGQWTGILASGLGDSRGMTQRALQAAKFSDKGSDFIAKLDQVRGGTFIAAIADLKAASPKGTMGTGALTETEGAKLQAAKAALDPQQGVQSFYKQLETYARQLEVTAAAADADAQRLKLQVKPLAKKPLVPAARGRRAAPAPAAAPAAPVPSNPQNGGNGEEWERGPDGKLRRKGQ